MGDGNEKLIAKEIANALLIMLDRRDAKSGVSSKDVVEILKQSNLTLSKIADPKKIEKFMTDYFTEYEKRSKKDVASDKKFFDKMSREFQKEFGVTAKEIGKKLDELKGTIADLFDDEYFKSIRTLGDIHSNLKAQTKYLTTEKSAFAKELEFIFKGKNNPMVKSLNDLNDKFADFFTHGESSTQKLLENQLKMYDLNETQLHHIEQKLNRYSKMMGMIGKQGFDETGAYIEESSKRPLNAKGVKAQRKNLEKMRGEFNMGALHFENKTSMWGEALGLGFLQRKGRQKSEDSNTARNNRIDHLQNMSDEIGGLEQIKYSLVGGKGGSGGGSGGGDILDTVMGDMFGGSNSGGSNSGGGDILDTVMGDMFGGSGGGDTLDTVMGDMFGIVLVAVEML